MIRKKRRILRIPWNMCDNLLYAKYRFSIIAYITFSHSRDASICNKSKLCIPMSNFVLFYSQNLTKNINIW